MPKTPHVALSRHLQDALLEHLKGQVAGPRPEAPAPAGTEEEPLFGDHDPGRGHGHGYYAADEAENASRRLDMRGPLDEDPGPIEMEEAGPDASGGYLRLTGGDA
jgi:hypothetical protein